VRVDTQTWRELLERHDAFATGLARERLRRAGFGDAEAEDVVQEVWARLLAKGPPAGFSKSFRSYLATAVLNAAREWLRTGARRAGRETAYASPGPSPEAPDDPLLGAERSGRLRQALARLDAEDRLLLQWAYWDDLSYARISRLLGISEDSVGPRLSRVRGALKRQLENDETPPGGPTPRHP
jgi:RNA polymerase sigma-70 factor (ECF subfamily)